MNGRLTKRMSGERQSALQQTLPSFEPLCRPWAMHCGEVISLIDVDNSCKKDTYKESSSRNYFISEQACKTCSRIPGGCLGVPAEVCSFPA